MENTATRSALHPLLTVAAIAVTVFSAVGVATLTGMIPQSRGTTAQPAPTEVVQPAPVVAAPKPKAMVKKKPRAQKRWDVTVRLDDGTTQTLSSPSEPFWHAGDRVRLHEGKLLNS